MLSVILFTATVFPSDPASAALERRLAAAAILRSEGDGDRARRDISSVGLASLVQRGRRASELLGESHISNVVDGVVDDARWRSVLEPELAARWLETELERLADDLEFEPVLEAALPLGFPAPTPVRDVELKRYPGYRMARAAMDGGRIGGAFWSLFAHIESNEIAMTAPVETSFADTDAGLRESSMAFLYGTPELGRVGRDGAVEVVDVEPALVVSVGRRGRASAGLVEAARAELQAWVAAHPEFAVTGDARVLSYNSPRVPTRRRLYEVQLPVRRAEVLIVDFSSPETAARWRAVDDDVMGGRSSSSLLRTVDDACVFSGRVSLENNGGFASVRAALAPSPPAGASLLALRTHGDGHRYKLRLYTSRVGNGVAYQAAFTTEADAAGEHTFRAADFTAVWRGRSVRSAPELSFGDVTGVGILISDEQEGPFRLVLRALAAR